MSCRPCDFPQLAVFKDLQAQTNRILVARRIELPPEFRDGNGSSLLWIDGRIGPKTTTAVGLAAIAAEQVVPVPAELLNALRMAANPPVDSNPMGAVAQHAKEIATYFSHVADQINAGAATSGTPTAAELLKTPEEEDIVTTKATKGRSWVWWLVGAAALAGAGGLGYYLWKRSKRGDFAGADDDDEYELNDAPGGGLLDL